MTNVFGSYDSEKIGHLYIGGTDPQEFALKRILMPGETQKPRYNYILDTGKTDVPFVSIHKIHGEHKLAGVYVPENMRGKGLGKTLLGVAFELAERTRGIIESTSVMRKPTIAALLDRYGFSPEGDGVQVKIIGEETHGGDVIPVVYPLSEGRLETVSDDRKFLIVSREPRDAKRQGKIVTLSVPYRLEETSVGQQRFVSARMEDRGKFLIRDLNPDFKI